MWWVIALQLKPTNQLIFVFRIARIIKQLLAFRIAPLPRISSSVQSKQLFVLRIPINSFGSMESLKCHSLNFKELLVFFRSVRFECTNEWIFLFEKRKKERFRRFPGMHW